jgi:1,5-anhydro-D-fructose reductase (1,5-anhydro-D-mannitol-forming)
MGLEDAMSEKRELGWGLVGASTIARQFMVPAIRTQPDSRTVAVMSSRKERGEKFAEENSIPRAYDSLEALLEDSEVDAVYVSTTNELHKEQTLAAAAAGKAVLCEKPLALTLGDAVEMIDFCRRRGVLLATNHHLRNAATHRAMRRLVREGAVGEVIAARVFHAVYLPENLHGWRLRSLEAGGGVILDITVHDADTLRFVLDDEVEEVAAISAEQGLGGDGIEDSVMGVMQFRSGALASFHDSFVVRHAGTGLEIHGTEGSLLGRDIMTQLPAGEVILRREDGVEKVDMGDREDLYVRAVRLFNDAVRGEGRPAATDEDGLRSLAVALAAKESSSRGRRVSVAHPDLAGPHEAAR